MTTINTPTTVYAETRSVTVSEDGVSFSITEQENGDIHIVGLELLELSPAQAEILSAALSIWKWGIIPAASDD